MLVARPDLGFPVDHPEPLFVVAVQVQRGHVAGRLVALGESCRPSVSSAVVSTVARSAWPSWKSLPLVRLVMPPPSGGPGSRALPWRVRWLSVRDRLPAAPRRLVWADGSESRCPRDGGSRGLGAHISQRLAVDGWAVAVNYRAGQAAAESVVESIREAGGVAEAFGADVVDEAAVTHLVAEVERRLGPVGAVVANATGPQPEAGSRGAHLARPPRPAGVLRQESHPAGAGGVARHARERAAAG